MNIYVKYMITSKFISIDLISELVFKSEFILLRLVSMRYRKQRVPLSTFFPKHPNITNRMITQAAFKIHRNHAFDSSAWKINPWGLFSPPIMGSVRNEVRYFISIQSGCILVKIGHGFSSSSGPSYIRPMRAPTSFCPLPLTSPVHARTDVTLSFGSSSSHDWSLQHNSSRRHEHKYYDRLLFMRRA